MNNTPKDSTGLFRHALNYFGANISVQALAVFSVPILTRLLSQKDYGMVNVYLSFITVTGIILSLNFHTAVNRYYFEKEKNDFGEFLGTSLILTFISICFISLIAILAKDFIISKLSINNEIFWGLIIISPLLVLQNVYISLNNAFQNSKQVMLNTIFISYGRFLFTLIFIFLVGKTYVSKIIADIAIYAIASVFYIKFFLKLLNFSFKREHVKYILMFSMPLLPHSLSSVILHVFDSIMINSISGADKNALYSIAYTIGMLSFIVYQSFHIAAQPIFFNMMSNGNFREAKLQALQLNKTVLFFTLGVSIFGVDIGRVLTTSNYYTALNLVPIIALGYYFMSSYQLYGRIMFFEKKTFLVAATTISSGVLNIVLNMFLIPKYGYKIAALNTAFTFLVTFIIGWFICTYYLKSKGALKITSFFRQIVFLLIMIALSVYFTHLSITYPLYSILIKLFILIVLMLTYFRDVINNILGVFLKKNNLS